MIEQQLTPPQMITTPGALHDLARVLAREPRLAVDTEANSLFAYHERVCLLQISTPDSDYLIDPLAVPDLSPLAPLFADPGIEKVFHAADYDLLVLRRDHAIHCSHLFDTMWAARILGWPRVGLGDILGEHFGVHPNKRFQRHDWGLRPIEPRALAYAMMDTHYLLPLREIQLQALQKNDRWEEAQEIFAYLSESSPAPQGSDRNHLFWRIKGVHDLTFTEQRILFTLYRWREEVAERLDRPTMKVISNERLLNLTRVQPRTKTALAAAGLSPHQVRRFGKGILQALRTHPAPDPPPQPDHTFPPEAVVERYNVLKAWRKTTAEKRGVDSDVILPNAILWELAHHPPTDLNTLGTVIGIGPWRKKTYGPELLRLLRK